MVIGSTCTTSLLGPPSLGTPATLGANGAASPLTVCGVTLAWTLNPLRASCVLLMSAFRSTLVVAVLTATAVFRASEPLTAPVVSATFTAGPSVSERSLARSSAGLAGAGGVPAGLAPGVAGAGAGAVGGGSTA